MTIERLLDAGRALQAGDLERARQIYRQVADADPRNSIAFVGLARVALERGKPAEAAGFARTALAIDPANPAARRLLDVLGEAAPPRESGSAGTPPREGQGRPGQGEAPPPEAEGPPPAAEGPPPGADSDEAWPWPDLDEQLARYRDRRPGLLSRLLRRGQR